MNKLSAVLLAVAILAGCASQPDPSDPRVQRTGFMCATLISLPTFEPKHLDYLQATAGDGNPGCMAALGRVYQEGEPYGVMQNFDKARTLYTQAAQSSPGAYAMLGQMAELGQGQLVDYTKARTLYRLAGKPGNTGLARLLEQGKGGAQDLPQAMTLNMAAMRTYGDTAWQAVGRLRKLGQPLDASQQQRYRKLWIQEFQRRLRKSMRTQAVIDAVKAADVDGQPRKVTLIFSYSPTSAVPEVQMRESSGNVDVDASIERQALTIRLEDALPFPGGGGKLKLNAPLAISPAG